MALVQIAPNTPYNLFSNLVITPLTDTVLIKLAPEARMISMQWFYGGGYDNGLGVHPAGWIWRFASSMDGINFVKDFEIKEGESLIYHNEMYCFPYLRVRAAQFTALPVTMPFMAFSYAT